MASTIGIPEALREKVETFVKSQEIPLTLVSPDTGNTRVVESAERQESSATVLYAGGWIRCHVALSLARELNIESRNLGKILNLLKIKIRDCRLGCFK